jgi:hypothetical protein
MLQVSESNRLLDHKSKSLLQDSRLLLIHLAGYSPQHQPINHQSR